MIPFWCACCTAAHTCTNSPSRCHGVRRCSSQYLVIGPPLTRSMTKYGRPASVAPASSTLAMLGWSISASACRSASNRAMTCRLSIPALMTFTATSRLTGSVCWAIHTAPMPPSPTCSISLYGPITVPGLCVVGWSMVAAGSLPAGRSSRLSGASAAASRASTWAIRVSSPPQASRTYARRRSGSGMSRAAWKIASLSGRDAVMGASAAGRPTRPGHNARNRGRTRNDFFCRSGPAAGGGVDGDPEAAAAVGQVLLGGGGRDAQRRGRLLGGEAGEEPELDQGGLARVLRLEPPEGLVQGEQAVAVALFQGRLDGVEVQPAAPASGL